MRYEAPNPELFAINRRNFLQRMTPGSVAVFVSNNVPTTNADGVLPFVQNSDLFYLTGIDQEETCLLLFAGKEKEQNKELLFVRRTNEHLQIWEGTKLSIARSAELSGIKKVNYTDDFETTFRTLCLEAHTIYLNTNEHLRADAGFCSAQERFVETCQKNFPLHRYQRSAPILAELRTIKHDEEISMIKKAGEITGKAFLRVLQTIKPGMYEYEVEAEILHEFMLGRSRRPAFDTIVASGANACILHYIQNNRQLNDNDMVLIDFGAEYGNYKADVTRCVPVNGKFSPEQLEVYKAVLHILKQATSLLYPGNTYEAYMKEVVALTEEQLVSLGLLTTEQTGNPDEPHYKKYFMHGVSHFLGLDVHDVGTREGTFKPGMVFTCEPGIYIADKGIGVRLENDILITEAGPVNLTAHIPIEPEEIEYIMARADNSKAK